ncbi:MAG TPA: TldD/PmbA family protein [Planctomycetota bacterium]|nr:TldD/PmbA family protein [Planctomycetota bacterium]
MREAAAEALDAARARGASNAAVRIVERTRLSIEVRDGRPRVSKEETAGASVRALVDGAAGLAAGPRATREELAELVSRACAAAKCVAREARGNPIDPAPAAPAADRWQSACADDPFASPVDRWIDVLRRLDARLRAPAGVATARASFVFVRERSRLVTLEGASIDQSRTLVGARLAAVAARGSDSVERSFPLPSDEPTYTGGFEMLAGLRLEEEADRVAIEAAALLDAPPCPRGTKDLLVGGPQLAALVHATLGRALERDRARDGSAPALRVGDAIASEAVDLAADPTLAGGLASTAYDDEGIPTARFPLVRAGRVTAFLTSRETARSAGEPSSRGCARAADAGDPPSVRAPNLALAPGAIELVDLVADTKDAILVETPSSAELGSSTRYRVVPECAWEVRDGRRVRLLRSGAWIDATPELWKRCDALASSGAWRVWPTGLDAKGSPPREVLASAGVSVARFRGVELR